MQKGRHLQDLFLYFFPSKEELVLEALRYQRPKLLQYAKQLMEDPLLSSASNWLPSSALGGTPGVWEGVPSLSILPDSLILSEGKVSFTVERSRNFNFQVEQSSDLVNWTISEAVIRDDQVEIPVSGNPDCYYRLRIP